MPVRSALFPSPMKNLFHSLVFKTVLAAMNIRTLQFFWLKREVNAASPGSLHIWYPDREKKSNKILLQKFHTNGIISVQACNHQIYRVVTFFSIFPSTIIIAPCVYSNLKLAWLFFHKLSAKKKIQSSNRTLPHSYLNVRMSVQTNILHLKFPSQDKRFKTKENTTQYEHFMATKKGRSPVSQAAMLQGDSK